MYRLAVSTLAMALLGCEAGSGSGDPLSPETQDVSTDDARGGDGEPDAPISTEDIAEEPDIYVPGPPVALEEPLTGLGNDALFPDLAGDDLVWTQGKPIEVAADAPAGEGPGGVEQPAVDCLTCPSCGGSTWEIRHKRLPNGPETLIAQETYPQSCPRVSDGQVAWIHSDGTIGLWRIADADLRTITTDNGWINATPIPFAGALWWYGYSPQVGQSGLIRFDLADGVSDFASPASMYENWTTPNGNLSGLARWQPFSLGADGAVWTEWGDQSQKVRRWALDSPSPNAVTIADDPLRDYSNVVTLGDGRIVTKSYERALGCNEQKCHPEIRLHTPGAPDRELAADGKVTIYGRPVVAGGRVFWLDYRDGPYAIWSRSHEDPDAEPERLTSEDAILGATAPPAATANRLVWMDRRDGVWRIYGKSL